MTWLLLELATALTLWASWPPRSDERRWLLFSLLLWWALIVVEGGRRGVQPGFWPWLLLLALIGAAVALLVLWSAANLLARPRLPKTEE